MERSCDNCDATITGRPHSVSVQLFGEHETEVGGLCPDCAEALGSGELGIEFVEN